MEFMNMQNIRHLKLEYRILTERISFKFKPQTDVIDIVGTLGLFNKYYWEKHPDSNT